MQSAGNPLSGVRGSGGQPCGNDDHPINRFHGGLPHGHTPISISPTYKDNIEKALQQKGSKLGSLVRVERDHGEVVFHDEIGVTERRR